VFPVGPLLILSLVILIASGWFRGALAALGLHAAGALVLLGGALALGPVHWRPFPTVTVSLGMTALPALVILLLPWLAPAGALPARRASPMRSVLTVLGALLRPVLVGIVVAIAGRFFPPGAPTELNLFGWDAQVLYLGLGALAGAGIGRQPLQALQTAFFGLLLADGYHAWRYAREGRDLIVSIVSLGGGALWGSGLTAGILAFALARLVAVEPVHAPVPLARNGTGT
jgi:hypothetical protein